MIELHGIGKTASVLGEGVGKLSSRDRSALAKEVKLVVLRLLVFFAHGFRVGKCLKTQCGNIKRKLHRNLSKKKRNVTWNIPKT